MTRAMWCGNVIGDMESRQSASRLSVSSSPKLPPMRNVSCVLPGDAEIRHAAAQLLARAGLSLHAEGDDRAAAREPLADERGLRGQRLPHLRGRGILGQARLRQLGDLELAEALQPFTVFLHCIAVELLLQFPHTEDADLLHC